MSSSTADINKQALDLHRRHQGKLEVSSLVEVEDRALLSQVYTPGVAEPCRVIAADKDESFNLTMRGRTIAVVSDGSSVLGLGNIGPEAAMPVMEGKALLMKKFAGVDAVPLVIDTQDEAEIVKFVKLAAPSFAGINLEDITAPKCFAVEEALQDIGIPVFHDDQHGTAIVVMAALTNAAKVVGKKYSDLKVVVVGSGSAGMAVSRMLLGVECLQGSCRRIEGAQSVADLVMVDSKGAIHLGRNDLNSYKKDIASYTNKTAKSGQLGDVISGADVVIGVSRPDLISKQMVESMADSPVVFALANPDPEILPNEALEAGAAVVATGRSDFPNQINNVLAFPAVFRAVVDARPKTITTKMKQAAALALAELEPNPIAEKIIPDPFMPGLADKISKKIIAAID